MRRSAEKALVKLREGIMTRFLAKQIKASEASSFLGIHPKSFSRLLRRYKRGGKQVLVPRKPGPKRGRFTPANRTSSPIVKSILKLRGDNPKFSLRRLAQVFRQQGNPTLHPSTILRILQRLKTAKPS